MLAYQDRKLIRAIHLFQRHKDARGPVSFVLRSYGKIAHAFWTIISGSDISRNSKISSKARFPHLTGVVVHQAAIIEDDCQVMQQVTIGQLAGTGAPVLKKGCYIGSGAKVLGDITIGEFARIGANAVVLQDIPAGRTAVGVPARILDKQRDRASDNPGSAENSEA